MIKPNYHNGMLVKGDMCNKHGKNEIYDTEIYDTKFNQVINQLFRPLIPSAYYLSTWISFSLYYHK